MSNKDNENNEEQQLRVGFGEKYEVGYGKPPKKNQFKRGFSGNNKGRPKGSKNFHSLLNDVLSQPMVVTENGKTLKISKKVAIIMQTVNKAVTGDQRAAAILIPHILTSEAKKEDQERVLNSLNVDDDAIIDSYVKNLNKGDEEHE